MKTLKILALIALFGFLLGAAGCIRARPRPTVPPMPPPTPPAEYGDVYITVKSGPAFLPGALVVLDRLDEPTWCRTDDLGRCIFTHQLVGPRHAWATKDGYAPGSLHVDINANQRVEIIIELGPLSLPTTTPVNTQRRAGRVRLDNKAFADDGGPFFALGATHMNALRVYRVDNARFQRNVHYLRDHGVHAQRVLTMLGWRGEEIDPRAPDHFTILRAVIADACDNNVRTQVTVFADVGHYPHLWQHGERQLYMERVAEVLNERPECILFVETANEPGHSGSGDFLGNWEPRLHIDELIDATRTLKRLMPWALVAAGAPYGIAATEWSLDHYQRMAEAGDFAVPHTRRGSHDDVLRGKTEVPTEWPWYDNEPQGPGSSVSTTNDPTALVEEMLAARSAHALGWTWHTRQGVGAFMTEPLSNAPGLPEVSEALGLKPQQPAQPSTPPPTSSKIEALRRVAAAYLDEYRMAHGEERGTFTREQSERFVRRAAAALHCGSTRLGIVADPAVGLNGKRGTDVLSQDALNRAGDGIYDIIIAAGEHGTDLNRLSWNKVDEAANGRWIQPSCELAQ